MVRSRLIALLILIASPTAGWRAQPLPGRPAEVARLAKVGAYYQQSDGFQGITAIERNHRLVFSKGYGFADLERQVPFTLDTRFRIASLSKQFTAAAILLLQQDGKLMTSDPISRFYPQAPGSWSKITLHNLLSHTSGIPDFDFAEVARNAPRAPEDLVGEISNKSLDFIPGTKFEYANVNYLLLGFVIQKASGEPYCRFLRERIFSPLRLKHTGCDSLSANARGSATGYYYGPKGPVPVKSGKLDCLDGAGSLNSTAHDLIRWTEALYDGKVLSPASLIEMTTPSLGDYGYGIKIDREGQVIDYNHDGAVDGFLSFLDYLPARRTTVVVLSNLLAPGNEGNPGTFSLATELVRVANDPSAILPSEGTEAVIPEEVLRGFRGRYHTDDSGGHPQTVAVTLRDGHLWISDEGTHSNPEQLRAESTSEFYLAHRDVEVVFGSDGTLNAVNFDAFQGNTYRRIPDGPSAQNDPGASHP